MADVVEIFLKLQQVAQFVSGAKEASSAVEGVGKSAEKSGKQANAGWKGLAKWAGGATALYGAQRYIRGAVDDTTSLAKSTIALQRTTNLDTETASAWVNVLKERGIQTRSFQMGMIKLSKEMEKSRLGTVTQGQAMQQLNAQYAAVAAAGGKDAPKALAKLRTEMDHVRASGAKARSTLDQLGVSQKAIRSGNSSQVLYQVADALEHMHNPAERAAAAQNLFGRAGVQLLPILSRGRKGIDEAIGTQEKYHNVLTGKSIKDTQKLVEQQRSLSAAMAGAKLQLGVALLPVLTQVAGLLVKLANIIAPLTKNATLFKIAVGLLAAAFIAYKVAIVYTTIAELGLNAAMLTNPFFLVIAAIVALGIGLVVLYKKWKWFHDLVNATFDWIKANWPLLLGILAGPFGIAAVEIIRHFGTIKKGVTDLIAFITNAFDKLVAYVRNIPHRITGALGKAAGFVGKVASHFPGAAAGGTVTGAGGVLVGERGPELLSLPVGATVSPLQAPLAVAGAGGGGRALEVIVPVMIDGRQVARSVARVTADRLARR